jgi:outer membrane biosynthesis protein TonB
MQPDNSRALPAPAAADDSKKRKAAAAADEAAAKKQAKEKQQQQQQVKQEQKQQQQKQQQKEQQQKEQQQAKQQQQQKEQQQKQQQKEQQQKQQQAAKTPEPKASAGEQQTCWLLLAGLSLLLYAKQFSRNGSRTRSCIHLLVGSIIAQLLVTTVSKLKSKGFYPPFTAQHAALHTPPC